MFTASVMFAVRTCPSVAVSPTAASIAVVALCWVTGCAHTVEISSEPPGAEVFVEGKSIGQTPTTWQEKSGSRSPVDIVLKRGADERVVTLQRKQVSWEAVGAGAGAGVGVCAAANCIAVPVLFVPWVGALAFGVLGSLGWAAIPAGPLVSWFFFGNTGPDSVQVNFQENQVQSTPAGLATLRRREGAAKTDPPPPPDPVGY